MEKLRQLETGTVKHANTAKVISQESKFNNNYNNIYLLQWGCYPVAVVILNVNKTCNWLLLNLSREGYMRNM